MKKKILWLVALLVIPQFICAAALTNDFSNKELKEDIINSLTQSKEQASIRNNLLLRAVRKNMLTEVKALLKIGANINCVNENQETPLYIASENGFIEIVDYLLSHKNSQGNYDAKVNAKNKKGLTPLMIASAKGHTETVRTLISKGADIKLTTKEAFNPLIIAVWKNQSDTALYLINHIYLNLNAKTKYGDTALMLCSMRSPHYYDSEISIGEFTIGNRNKILKALLDKQANINAQNDDGKTALLIALEQRQDDIARELIRNSDLDIRTQDNNGNTALHKAKNISLVQSLILKGAQVNVANKNGTTPLMYAAANSNFNIVQKLVSSHANINAKDKDNENALVYALKGDCNLDIIDFLIKKGIDTRVKDKRGNSLTTLAQAEDGNCYMDKKDKEVLSMLKAAK